MHVPAAGSVEGDQLRGHPLRHAAAAQDEPAVAATSARASARPAPHPPPLAAPRRRSHTLRFAPLVNDDIMIQIHATDTRFDQPQRMAFWNLANFC